MFLQVSRTQPSVIMARTDRLKWTMFCKGDNFSDSEHSIKELGILTDPDECKKRGLVKSL